MALPEVIQTIRDGGLGIIPEAPAAHVKVGVSSSGTVNSVYSFNDLKTLVDTLGEGPLVEACAHALSVAGGPVYALKVDGQTAGAAGSVAKAGSGPDVTVAGAAKDDYEVILLVTTGGALGTSAFKFSLDGGDTYSAAIATPSGGTYVLGTTGLTLTFAAGTYVVNTTYSFTCTAPGFDTTALNASLTALLADPREWRFVHVVGRAANVTDAASIAAAIQTKLAAAATAYRYVRGIMECPTDTDANILTAFAAVDANRVMVAVDTAEVTSPITGRIHKRPAAWTVAARMAKSPIHEDLGRVASGSLPGVTALTRDERATPGLDAGRFTTLRTFVGVAGRYITAGRLMAVAGSDYEYVQHGLVMDEACRVARNALLRFLNDTVRVNASGTIYEKDALNIEASVKAQLDAALVSAGHASSTQVLVSRTENILSTKKLPVTIRVVPLGYMRAISVDIGFTNPALALA